MSKLRCKCGHVIADKRNDLLYKASFVPDKLHSVLYEDACRDIALFIQAITTNQREHWISEFFTSSYVGLGLTDEQIIDDVFSRYYSKYHRSIYQCEQCKRIHIQTGRSNYFSSFLPESEGANDILDA